MPDPSPAATLLFLREEDLRQGVELLYFATRDFAAECDAILAEHDIGRPHHLALHFIAREPQITVSALGELTALSKQSLGRVLDLLIERGLVAQKTGLSDRRQRLLALTATGATLEKSLSDRQRARIARAYRDAGAAAVDGFRKVLLGLVSSPQDRRRFDRPADTGARR
jgi:DNA-binding MarR family transcriptional regulator